MKIGNYECDIDIKIKKKSNLNTKNVTWVLMYRKMQSNNKKNVLGNTNNIILVLRYKK